MNSLKSKFAIVITILIFGAIFTTSFVLVQQKRTELQEDIYLNARSFSELSSQKIADSVVKDLEKDNFLFFQRDLNSILKNNSDIESLEIYDFNGKILYNSSTEQQRQYLGDERQVTDSKILTRIKSANPSVETKDQEIFYLDKISPGNYEIITEQGNRLRQEPSFHNLSNLIHTVEGKYAINYQITYDNLTQRLLASAYQILIISAIAILISIIAGFFLSSIVTNPLKKLTAIVELIAKGDFSKRAEVTTKDEVGQLAESVNHMALDLEKATDDKIFKEKVKKELEIAAQIQRDILPTTLPQIPDLDISASLIPATEIGGDVYDVLLDENQTPYFYLGDVTGHGVPAGLLSSVANAIVTSTLNLADPVKIMDNLNTILKSKSSGTRFITILFARYISGNIEYVSAGHERSIYFSQKKNGAEYLPAAGIALGLFENIKDKLTLSSVPLEPGDVFITYTDGITEAWKSDTEQYGEEQFLISAEKAIRENPNNAEAIKEQILADLKAYMGDYEQQDDITLIVVQRKS